MSSTNEPVADLEQRALNKMRSDVGKWDCRWEFLDDNQQVVSVANGIQTMTFVIPDAVMQIMMDVPDMDTQSVTHRFFHQIRQRLFWISVDNQGDYWQFVEELDGATSYSLPHENPDGTTTYLRFQALRETTDEVDILMESSEDNQTWVPIFRQYRVRR